MLGVSAVANPTFLPFLSATVVPWPPQVALTLGLDEGGSVALPLSGGGGPASLFLQAVAFDAALPGGFAVSNAVQANFLP